MTTTSSDGGALRLRNNFVKAISHQIALADNADYTFRGVGGVAIKPRRWWMEKAGECRLFLRCGTARIDGDNPITCERENLATVLEGVRRDAEEGVLDSILVEAAGRVTAKRRDTIAAKNEGSAETTAATVETPPVAIKAEKKKDRKGEKEKEGKLKHKRKKEAEMAKDDKKVKKEKKEKKKDKKKNKKKKDKKKKGKKKK